MPLSVHRTTVNNHLAGNRQGMQMHACSRTVEACTQGKTNGLLARWRIVTAWNEGHWSKLVRGCNNAHISNVRLKRSADQFGARFERKGIRGRSLWRKVLNGRVTVHTNLWWMTWGMQIMDIWINNDPGFLLRHDLYLPENKFYILVNSMRVGPPKALFTFTAT